MYLRKVTYQLGLPMKSLVPCFHKSHLENLVLLMIGIAHSRKAAEFTFINLFEIPEGEGDQFRLQWRETIERLMTAPGFLFARLYEAEQEFEAALLQTPGVSAVLQNRPQGKARFGYIWVSQRAPLTEYETAVRSFGRGAALPFPSNPAFYQGG